MRPWTQLAALALVAAAPAARACADEIVFPAGRTPLKDVDVVSETYETVSYRIKGSLQNEPTPNIADVIHTEKSALYRGAEAKFQKRDFAGAAEDFRKVVTDDKKPRDDHLWQKHYARFYLGESLRQRGDAAAAIEAYEGVIKDNEKSRFYGPVKLGIGLCKLATSDRAGARTIFSELEGEAKAKKLGDRWADAASLAAADVLESEGKLQDALDRYRKVANAILARGDKTSAAAKATINADRLSAKQDPSKASQAAQALQKALEEQYGKKDGGPDPEVVAAAYNALGDVHAARDDHKKALLAYLHVVTEEDFRSLAGERAKALYCAAVALEKVKAEDWKNRADLLRRELRELYAGSIWATKK